jgi:hypothetical protein
MLDALVDHSLLVYIILIVVCSALLFAWRRNRKFGYLLATGIGLIVVVGFAILTQVVHTDQRKIIDVIKVCAKSVELRDLKTIDSNLAATFHLGRENKSGFMKWGSDAIRAGNAQDITVWDFTVDSMDKQKGTAQVTFMAKPHGNWSQGVHFRVEADMVREGDGKWRLQTFRVFKPFSDGRTPQDIPGIGT